MHRASALGWDGVAATKSSLPTVSQAGTVATITPPVNAKHLGSTPAGRRFPASFWSISALANRKWPAVVSGGNRICERNGKLRVEVFAVFAQVSPSRGKGAGGSGGVHGMVRSTSGGSSGGGWAMDSG